MGCTRISLYVLVIVAALFSPLASPAADPSTKDAGESAAQGQFRASEARRGIDETEETEYAYGTVETVDLSANAIVIKEQNYDDDTETVVTYYLNSDTAFENINSLREVALGNDVDISYLVRGDGKKIVKFISVYKPELEGEEE